MILRFIPLFLCLPLYISSSYLPYSPYASYTIVAPSLYPIFINQSQLSYPPTKIPTPFKGVLSPSSQLLSQTTTTPTTAPTKTFSEHPTFFPPQEMRGKGKLLQKPTQVPPSTQPIQFYDKANAIVMLQRALEEAIRCLTLEEMLNIVNSKISSFTQGMPAILLRDKREVLQKPTQLLSTSTSLRPSSQPSSQPSEKRIIATAIPTTTTPKKGGASLRKVKASSKKGKANPKKSSLQKSSPKKPGLICKKAGPIFD